MTNDIATFKSEIKNLSDRKSKLELEVAKIQAKKETLEADLKEKFNITPDEIEDKLESLKKESKAKTEEVNAKLIKAKDYISKLEAILNGC